MSNIKRQALANRRAGVQEALTLINNSRDLAQARLIVEGLLARIDAEYKTCQETSDCAWNQAKTPRADKGDIVVKRGGR